MELRGHLLKPTLLSIYRVLPSFFLVGRSFFHGSKVPPSQTNSFTSIKLVERVLANLIEFYPVLPSFLSN